MRAGGKHPLSDLHGLKKPSPYTVNRELKHQDAVMRRRR